MKTVTHPRQNQRIQRQSRLLAGGLLLAAASIPFAADAQTYLALPDKGVETQKDVPADFHKYFGQRINSWRDRQRQIAKLDLDADMNQDGVLSNTDPADSGSFESTPPGVVLGVGELTRMVIRLIPYRVDFDGEVVVTLEVEGINRGARTGEFETLDEEIASMGHVRVWRNKDKKDLLLDSRDPTKRVVEFTTDYKTYPYNLPLAVPRFFFVEGVNSSPLYSGDVRILVTVSHRPPGQAPYAQTTSAKNVEPEVQAPPERVGIKSFRTSFDHVLMTVTPNHVPKEFINGNNEGVWVAPPGKSY
ncbi:MAG TPA: hypothetical protein DIT13_06140 [Verrucomicrobiales bacterium]|nr:hypothetical protein [Verrucomicrobiales bacterium]HRJ09286.1 hypothetical protein [Prosthecobacter sp.]HRK13916.1 hypothetical protein [Prosthecobacter sp.]